MLRVTAFIDGFNIYHSLMENGCSSLKWLDYWSLAHAFIIPSKEILNKVFYFTALATYDAEKVERHKTFIRAQEYKGCQIVYGKFKRVTKKCRAKCTQKYMTFEEKETDINIAVTMLLEAAHNKFDKAILFTGDSDLIAGIRGLKLLPPDKHIKVVIPYKRTSIDLENNCDSSSRIKRKHLERNQLPDTIELPNGKFICKPEKWK